MFLEELVFGASHEILIAAPKMLASLGVEVESLFLSADDRLPRIVAVSPIDIAYLREKFLEMEEDEADCIDPLEYFRNSGWKVVYCQSTLPIGGVYCDDREAIVTALSEDGNSTGHLRVLRHRESLMQFRSYFETLVRDFSQLELIFDDLLFQARKDRPVVVLPEQRWTELINRFAMEPQLLREIHPERFEEIVARLLELEGFSVQLTSRGPDGGVDVVASCSDVTGDRLVLVQCKRFASRNKVNVDAIRSLYGVVEEKKASAGLLVTTSSFTSAATRFQQRLSHRLSLRDFEDLKEWVQRIRDNHC